MKDIARLFFTSVTFFKNRHFHVENKCQQSVHFWFPAPLGVKNKIIIKKKSKKCKYKNRRKTHINRENRGFLNIMVKKCDERILRVCRFTYGPFFSPASPAGEGL